MKPIEGKSDCVVIIPTYNERENAAAIIEAAKGFRYYQRRKSAHWW